MAREFTPTNEGVTLANESDFDFSTTDPFSMIFFFRTDDATGAFDWLVAKSDNGEAGSWYCDYDSAEIMEFTIRVSGGAFHVTKSTSLLNSGNWIHLACTKGSDANRDAMRAYFDGIEESQGDALTMSGTITNNVDMRYANSSQGSLDLDGELFYVCICDSECTAQQVLSMSKGIPPIIAIPFASIKAFTPLWGNQDPEPDWSGNGNTGALIGTPTKVANPPAEHIENYL